MIPVLPKVLTKNIDDIHSATTRVLVVVLLFGLCIVTTAYYKSTQARLEKCEDSHTKTEHKLDSVLSADRAHLEDDYKRLQARVAWQDSVKDVLKKIIVKQQRK